MNFNTINRNYFKVRTWPFIPYVKMYVLVYNNICSDSFLVAKSNVRNDIVYRRHERSYLLWVVKIE